MIPFQGCKPFFQKKARMCKESPAYPTSPLEAGKNIYAHKE
jgi:hypothetical protein